MLKSRSKILNYKYFLPLIFIQWGFSTNGKGTSEWGASQPLIINFTTPFIAIPISIEQSGRDTTENYDNQYRLYADHIVFRFFYHNYVAIGIS